MTKKLFTKESILRAQLATVTEAAVQAAILGYLRVNRIPHTITEAKQSFNENQQQVRRVKKGWPDITLCWPDSGQMAVVECKRPIGGRLSYAQADCLDSLWRAGAIVIIARSLDDVINALQAGKTPVETQAEIARTLQKGPEPPARKRLR